MSISITLGRENNQPFTASSFMARTKKRKTSICIGGVQRMHGREVKVTHCKRVYIRSASQLGVAQFSNFELTLLKIRFYYSLFYKRKCIKYDETKQL